MVNDPPAPTQQQNQQVPPPPVQQQPPAQQQPPPVPVPVPQQVPPPPPGGAGIGPPGPPGPPGGGGFGGGGFGPPPPYIPGGYFPPPAPTFALHPAQAAVGFIDYTTKVGKGLYTDASAPLPMEYNCDEENLLSFIHNLTVRSQASAWDLTTRVPYNGGFLNLFQSYGVLSVDTLRNFAGTYYDLPVRDAQNSTQMFMCLHSSLTSAAKSRVRARAASYTLYHAANGQPFVDGLLYFKAITQTAQVDTTATVNSLMAQLNNLASYMVTCDHDISAFNLHVDDILDGLVARSVHLTDTQILVHLFTGYTACADTKFRAYMTRQYEDYDDGTKTYTYKEVMNLALNKYTILAPEWLAQSSEQQQIVSLQAEIQALKQRRTNSAATSNSANNRSTKVSKATSSSTAKHKSKAKPTTNKPTYKKETPAWKLVPPKPGETQTKSVNEKTYHWCPHHKMWTLHKPSECKLQDKPKDTLQPNTKVLQSLDQDDDRSI